MDSIRLKKIASTYQEIITSLLFTDVKDPKLSGVRITGVTLTPDVRLAKVYFILEGGKNRAKEALKGLHRSKGYLKRALATHINLRYTPELEFYYDERQETGYRIEELLRQIETKSPPSDDPSSDSE